MGHDHQKRFVDSPKYLVRTDSKTQSRRGSRSIQEHSKTSVLRLQNTWMDLTFQVLAGVAGVMAALAVLWVFGYLVLFVSQPSPLR